MQNKSYWNKLKQNCKQVDHIFFLFKCHHRCCLNCSNVTNTCVFGDNNGHVGVEHFTVMMTILRLSTGRLILELMTWLLLLEKLILLMFIHFKHSSHVYLVKYPSSSSLFSNMSTFQFTFYLNITYMTSSGFCEIVFSTSCGIKKQVIHND